MSKPSISFSFTNENEERLFRACAALDGKSAQEVLHSIALEFIAAKQQAGNIILVTSDNTGRGVDICKYCKKKIEFAHDATGSWLIYDYFDGRRQGLHKCTKSPKQAS